MDLRSDALRVLGLRPELLDAQQRCHFLRWEKMGLKQGDQDFLLNFQVQKLTLRFLRIPFQLPELRLLK